MESVDREKTTKKTYSSIDCLKFFLAICVVGIHTSGPFGGTTLGLVIAIIIFTMAVPLYFAVSGFFFYGKIRKHLDVKTVKVYCWRLGRVYLLWTLLYIPHVITDYRTHRGWGMLENGIIVLIRNIFFLGSYNHLWYLLACIWGGILLFFCIKALKDWRKSVVLCIVIYCIALLFDSCAGIWPVHLRSIPMMYQGYFNSVRNGLLFGFPFMGIGIAAYEMQNMKSGRALLVAVLFFLYRIVATSVIKWYDMELGLLVTPGTWGCSLFLLVWLLRLELPISDALSQWLRKSSIIMFLIHPYMIDVASVVTNNSTVLFVLVVLLCLGFSAAVSVLEQKKGFGWLKHIY